MLDFMIIGTQKGGTQSFYRYLMQHPQVMPSYRPDLNFFDQNYSKGIEWYSRQFPLLSEYPDGQRPQGHITGEASPYYMYHPLVAERIKRHCPRTKFIVLLRNPTDRAYSHFRYAVQNGSESLSFSDALKLEAKRLERGKYNLMDNPFHQTKSAQFYSYISHGFYAHQLRSWFQIFDRDQFLIVRSEDYFKDPLPHVIRAHKFLGLTPNEAIKAEPVRSSSHASLSEGTRKIIEKIFYRPNEELCQMLGWAHAW